MQATAISPPSLTTVTLPNGDFLCFGRVLMPVPQGGPVVRQYSFVIPNVEIQPVPWNVSDHNATPAVYVLLDDGSAVPPPLNIYNITVVPDEGFTLIKVSAVTQDGNPTDLVIYCTLIAVGRPVP